MAVSGPDKPGRHPCSGKVLEISELHQSLPEYYQNYLRYYCLVTKTGQTRQERQTKCYKIGFAPPCSDGHIKDVPRKQQSTQLPFFSVPLALSPGTCSPLGPSIASRSAQSNPASNPEEQSKSTSSVNFTVSACSLSILKSAS